MRSVARSSISCTPSIVGTFEQPTPCPTHRVTYPRSDCTLLSSSSAISAADSSARCFGAMIGAVRMSAWWAA